MNPEWHGGLQGKVGEAKVLVRRDFILETLELVIRTCFGG